MASPGFEKLSRDAKRIFLGFALSMAAFVGLMY